LESEIKEIISFIFKRSGKKILTKSDFYLSLSIDLKWFTPRKANEFLNYILDNKFVIEINDMIQPNFDIENYKIPFGFKPKLNLLKTHNYIIKKKFIDISDLILNNKNDKIRNMNLINQISRIADEKNIYLNVAALIVYKKENISFKDHLKIVEDQILYESS
jgi:hypothetical protein